MQVAQVSSARSGKNAATWERGSGIGMDWCRLGVAIGARRGEVSHLSTRGNMRSGSLYCDVRSSPKDTLNHLSPHPIQILAILEPDLRPSTFKFMGHIYLVCQGSNNKISGTREVPWQHKNTKRNNILDDPLLKGYRELETRI